MSRPTPCHVRGCQCRTQNHDCVRCQIQRLADWQLEPQPEHTSNKPLPTRARVARRMSRLARASPAAPPSFMVTGGSQLRSPGGLPPLVYARVRRDCSRKPSAVAPPNCSVAPHRQGLDFEGCHIGAPKAHAKRTARCLGVARDQFHAQHGSAATRGGTKSSPTLPCGTPVTPRRL
jgi:hypothetical protein